MNYYNNQPTQQTREQPKCKFCNSLIKFRKENDRWIRYNMDGSLHDRVMCDKIKSGGTVLVSATPVSTTPAPNTMGAIDPHLNSILIQISDVKKAIMELKQLAFNSEKRDQTNATIIDSIAQKIELIMQKTGYPKPAKIINEEEEEEEEPKPLKDDKDIEEFVKSENEYFEQSKKEFEEEQKNIAKSEDILQKKPNQVETLKQEDNKDQEEKKKAIQEYKEEVIDPMRVPAQNYKDNSWTIISQPFLCQSCKTKTHNGYEQYGTKICEDCYNQIELTRKEISDVNNFPYDDDPSF